MCKGVCRCTCTHITEITVANQVRFSMAEWLLILRLGITRATLEPLQSSRHCQATPITISIDNLAFDTLMRYQYSPGSRYTRCWTRCSPQGRWTPRGWERGWRSPRCCAHTNSLICSVSLGAHSCGRGGRGMTELSSLLRVHMPQECVGVHTHAKEPKNTNLASKHTHSLTHTCWSSPQRSTPHQSQW